MTIAGRLRRSLQRTDSRFDRYDEHTVKKRSGWKREGLAPLLLRDERRRAAQGHGDEPQRQALLRQDEGVGEGRDGAAPQAVAARGALAPVARDRALLHGEGRLRAALRRPDARRDGDAPQADRR